MSKRWHVWVQTLGPVLDEKDKAEKRLWELAGDMEVVIVRPGGLKSDEATGKGILTEDQQLVGAITRKDTARMVVKALFSKKTGEEGAGVCGGGGLVWVVEWEAPMAGTG